MYAFIVNSDKIILTIFVIAETVEAVELGEFPDDEKLACYFKCVLEKVGMVKEMFYQIDYMTM